MTSTLTCPLSNTCRALLAVCLLVPFCTTGCSSTGRMALAYGLHTSVSEAQPADDAESLVKTAYLAEPGAPANSHQHAANFVVEAPHQPSRFQRTTSAFSFQKPAVESADFAPADSPSNQTLTNNNQ